MADQVGPPDAGGQVAGWQSAVDQVAGGAGGQGEPDYDEEGDEGGDGLGGLA